MPSKRPSRSRGIRDINGVGRLSGRQLENSERRPDSCSLCIAATVPGIVDNVMGRIRDQMLRDRENQGKTVSADSEETSLSEIPA